MPTPQYDPSEGGPPQNRSLFLRSRIIAKNRAIVARETGAHLRKIDMQKWGRLLRCQPPLLDTAEFDSTVSY